MTDRLPLFNGDDLPPDPIRAQRVETAKRTMERTALVMVGALLLAGFVIGAGVCRIVDALTTPPTPRCAPASDDTWSRA